MNAEIDDLKMPHHSIKPIMPSRPLTCASMPTLFSLEALNGLSECWTNANPILAPSSTYLSRRLRSHLVESGRLMNMLAQAALGNYWQTIPHLLIEMTQHIAEMLSPFGFNPMSKLPIDWGYNDFLSGVPKPFELVALGFLALIFLSTEVGFHSSLILFLFSFHLFLPSLKLFVGIS